MNNFRLLFQGILQQNIEEIEINLRELGLVTKDLPDEILTSILDIIKSFGLSIEKGKPYDLSNPKLISDMEALSRKFIENSHKISVPPINTLLVQRKVGGIFLLGKRFKARVNLKRIISAYT